MILLVLLSLLSVSSAQNVDELLEAFHKIDSERDMLEFEDQLSSSKASETPAFAACIEMMKAEYTMNPVSKWNHFSKGRDQLDDYISKNTKCVVGRYLRLMTQRETPAFLGYKDEITADEKFIKAELENSLISVKSKELIKKNLQFTAEKQSP